MLQRRLGDRELAVHTLPDVGARGVIGLVEAVLHHLPAALGDEPRGLVVLLAKRHRALERPVDDVLADAGGLDEIVAEIDQLAVEDVAQLRVPRLAVHARAGVEVEAQAAA